MSVNDNQLFLYKYIPINYIGIAGWPVPFNNHVYMDKPSRNIFIEGGLRMKLRFKANLDVKFEVKIKKNSRTKKENRSWIQKTLKWFSLIIVEFLFTELILKRLVALIIKIFTNGSFYFYNRMLYFEVKYG